MKLTDVVDNDGNDVTQKFIEKEDQMVDLREESINKD